MASEELQEVIALATENRELILEVKKDVKTLITGQTMQNGEIANMKGYWYMVRGALVLAAGSSPLIITLNLL